MPEPAPAIGAVARAAQQLERLRAGQVEAFLDGEPGYHDLCAQALSDEDGNQAPVLRELTMLHASILYELQRAMDDVSARMASLTRHRHIAGAYLAPHDGARLRATG